MLRAMLAPLPEFGVGPGVGSEREFLSRPYKHSTEPIENRLFWDISSVFSVFSVVEIFYVLTNHAHERGAICAVS